VLCCLQVQHYAVCGYEGVVVIGNDSWLVQSLCHLLDLVLCHGLRDIRRGYWRVVQKFCHSDTVRVIQSLKTVSTSLGRGTSIMQFRSTLWLYNSFMCTAKSIKA
jgi:hypothetical protein